MSELQMKDFILGLSSLIGMIAGALLAMFWRKR